MDSRDLTLTVCRLVAYLVANVVKDEKEYQEWGLPFIALSVEAQFGKEGEPILEDLNARFCPLIGHGLSLILEDPEWEDYTFIYSAESLLSSILDETESKDINFESTLKQYMDNFFRFVLAGSADDVYDARTRVIARRMCDAVNISAAEFSELESVHWQSAECAAEFAASEMVLLQNTEDEVSGNCLKNMARKKFHEKFNLESRKVPASSILASFRIWRVAFIAAGGGALMALSGRLAAPAIMSTVLPLICASNTVGQVSFALSTTLSCFGVTSLELIPGIMSSYGATIAGRKMLNRTAPLKDFALKPLHLDASEQALQKALSTAGAGADVTPSHTEAETAPAKPHVPVFILVSGHMERGLDARQLWGANGFLQSVVQGAVQSAVEVTTVAVSEVVSTVAGIESSTYITVSAAGSAKKEEMAESEISQTQATTAETTPANDTQKDEQLTDWEELQGAQGGWWRESISHGEEYVLNWEPGILESLNDSLQKILIDKMLGKLKGMVKGEILKFTPIPSLRAAATLPLLVMDKINELDDPWVVAMDRAHQAGKLLARVLLAEHRSHLADTNAKSGATSTQKGSATAGERGSSGAPPRLMGRPITLVGYGMGARLVFHCLETLAAEGGVDARGIVENAVLIGSPVSMEHSKWAAARSVVAGRLINCYAWNDWLLALLYRSKSYEIGVAGLYPIHLHPASAQAHAHAHSQAQAAAGAGVHLTDKYSADEGSHGEAPGVEGDPAAGDQDQAAVKGPERAAPRRLNHCSAHEVENCDVSHLISSHSDYPNVLPAIITLLNL